MQHTSIYIDLPGQSMRNVWVAFSLHIYVPQCKQWADEGDDRTRRFW